MKKKILAGLVIMAVALQLVACTYTPTCKESDCDETTIYEDGYCKYHYYLKTGEDMLKDFIN